VEKRSWDIIQRNMHGLIKILNYKEYRDFGLNLIAEFVLLDMAKDQNTRQCISEKDLKCINTCMSIVSEKAKVCLKFLNFGF
jgi:hypothetical protein